MCTLNTVCLFQETTFGTSSVTKSEQLNIGPAAVPQTSVLGNFKNVKKKILKGVSGLFH